MSEYLSFRFIRLYYTCQILVKGGTSNNFSIMVIIMIIYIYAIAFNNKEARRL